MNDGEWPDAITLLAHLREWGWTLYSIGPRDHPNAIAAVQRFGFIADVMIFRGHDRVAAYRTITDGSFGDPLRAKEVVWYWLGDAKTTMIHMIELRLDADTGQPVPIPDDCRLPELEDKRPIRVIPPNFHAKHDQACGMS